MTQTRSHAELVTLRKLAEDIAGARKERMTSVHLLAAVARSDGPAGELLRDRRLDDEVLLKASRAFDDDGPDPVGRLFAAARQVATRRVWYGNEPAPAPTRAGRGARPSSPRATSVEPTALHLLLALLSDRGAAAHRSLVHAGVDLARVRTAAMQVALGVVAPRRALTARAVSGGGESVADPTRKAGPPAPAPSREARAARPSSPPPSGLVRSTSGSSSLASAGPGVAVPIMPSAPTRARPSSPPPAPPARTAVDPVAPAAAAAALASALATPAIPTAQQPASTGAFKPSSALAARFALDRAQFPALTALGRNLTAAAAEGRLDAVVGRDDEIEHALDVLTKRHANSACLVGPAGVGKTSVARGLAARLVALDGVSDAPRVLIELQLSELCAGPGGRRTLAERFAAMRAELHEAQGRVILFVDDVHELTADPALDDALNELKLGLVRGDARLVATTTVEEWRRYVEPDAAFARRFSLVEIEEPDEESAFFLLRSVAAGLATHHGLAYADVAVAAAVSWAIRYLPGRALPDKAISILDLAGARARRKGGAPLREVGPAEVAAVVAEIADVPVERLLETDRDRMLSLEKLLAERVVGHGAAIARIARVLRRNAAGLRGRRPIGSFLLLGPTGVGKTETAKALAEALFHSPDAMTRLDFSEYSESHAVARLIGAPPGYVGHDAGGQLTEAVRRRPYQVILLDEIEKAHRDVLEAFLQVLDEGRLTDGRGRRVDFTNAVIMMTSNLGAAEIAALRDGHRVGFARSGPPTGPAPERLAETMITAARAHLPPELYNRIDEVLCFGPLARAEVSEIARRLLVGLAGTLEDRGIRLDVEEAVLDVLLDAGGFDVTLGARPMKRTLARLVENPLAELILRGELGEGSVALVGVEGDEIVVDALAEGTESAEAG
jgi:ATP-dependent Clp protease ATP-binding subunit ClpC